MPLRGSGIKEVEKVKPLGITVQGLRYLDFSRDELTGVEYKGCRLTIPRPEAFVFLKFIIHEQRKSPDKMEKDLTSARDLGTAMIGEEEHLKRLKLCFSRKPKKHQSRLLRITREKAVDVYEVLTDI